MGMCEYLWKSNYWYFSKWTIDVLTHISFRFRSLAGRIVRHHLNEIVCVRLQTDNQRPRSRCPWQIVHRVLFAQIFLPVFQTVSDQIAANLLANLLHGIPRHIEAGGIESARNRLLRCDLRHVLGREDCARTALWPRADLIDGLHLDVVARIVDVLRNMDNGHADIASVLEDSGGPFGFRVLLRVQPPGDLVVNMRSILLAGRQWCPGDYEISDFAASSTDIGRSYIRFVRDRIVQWRRGTLWSNSQVVYGAHTELVSEIKKK